MAAPAPPHDCRLTIRCLREDFREYSIDPRKVSFKTLCAENSFVEHFFERRRDDPSGGEEGERIRQTASRPVFSLHSRRTRGATWFDTGHPPQAIVWLLGAEIHDERHKGRGDAYDVFARLEAGGRLFPSRDDYRLLELHRRLWDTAGFATDVQADAEALLARAAEKRRVSGRLAGVTVRATWDSTADGTVTLCVAVSLEPVVGKRSGLRFPMDQRRFLLLGAAVRNTVETRHTRDVLAEEVYDFPAGGLRNERAFMFVFGSK